MNLRLVPAILLCGLAASGCTLGAAQPTLTVAPPTATQQPVVIDGRDQPNPTAAAAPRATNTVVPSGCTPRADWLAYTVQAGDTLGTLAQRTGSTTTALAQGNCLADANVIATGQTLRVPRAPDAVLPPPVQSGTQTFTSPSGFAFDYPRGWVFTELPGGPVYGYRLTTFDPASEPPHAAWLQGVAEVTFGIVPGALASSDLDTWAAVHYNELINGGLQVTEQIDVTLPSGLPGERFVYVSGSGWVMVDLLLIVNRQNVMVSGRGDMALVDAVLNSVRAV